MATKQFKLFYMRMLRKCNIFYSLNMNIKHEYLIVLLLNLPGEIVPGLFVENRGLLSITARQKISALFPNSNLLYNLNIIISI